ncbi:MAG: FG-GAP repeat domain-containing protein, partial [Chitinophagaceae bacterium]
TSTNGFFFADGLEQQLYFLSENNTLVDSVHVLKGVSNLRVTDSLYQILSMGVLQPSDSKEGKWVTIDPPTKNMRIIIDSLQRPVHVSYADLNRDGLEDLVVSEFGNQTGMLSWFENSGKSQYKKHILRPLPGAVKTVVYDFNKDGLPDIMAMMAQGDEGMFIYYNLGNNNFKEERVLQFPPSYGSNYFDLLDINKDGYPDIIATNGDNGDYPPVLKAYHGIRIYLNNGKNKFSEKLFLAVNGVGKAIAMDFDKDGDIDLASISFFPDYNSTPEEGFIYWENMGGLTYEPSSFNQVTAGRWLTMDAGDIDGDKDIDIVLGNAFIVIGNVPDSLKKRWESYRPSVIILRNNLNDISAP